MQFVLSFSLKQLETALKGPAYEQLKHFGHILENRVIVNARFENYDKVLHKSPYTHSFPK